MKSTVLITGGAGFVGSHLSEAFLKLNYQIICVDNLSSGSIDNINILKKISPSTLFINADVCGPWDWQKKIPSEYLRQLKYVFHFASLASPLHYQQQPLETIWANTLGLKNALTFSDQFSARPIFASTSEVYGDPLKNPQSENDWGYVNSFGERSCYDESKRLGEAIIYSYNKKFNTKHGLVRIFNTYGPRMQANDGRVIINFLVQILKKQPLTIYSEGQQTRSFCYIDDLVSGLLKYAFTEINTPINLGHDSEISIIELAKIIHNKFTNLEYNFEYKNKLADEPKKRKPGLTRALEHLNWKPQVNLNEGLDKTMHWLKNSSLK